MHATVLIRDGQIERRSQLASRLEMDGDVIRHAKGPHAERPVYPEGSATLHKHDDGVRVEMHGEWAMVRVIPEPPEPEYNDDGEQVNAWPEFPDPVWPDEAQAERERLDAITVSRFQAKAALDDAGLLDAIENYMTNDDVPRRVKLAWEEASFRRGSQMIADIGAELGLTEEQIDGLFIAAQEIEA